ncbi:MAG: hypothetical protein ACI9UO_002850, partial [Nitrospinales bacterium]
FSGELSDLIACMGLFSWLGFKIFNSKILHKTHKFLYQNTCEVVLGIVLYVMGLGRLFRSEFVWVYL